MTQVSAQPVDMTAWKAVADQMPQHEVVGSLKEVVETWRSMGATAILALWEMAFRHYEDALPDEASHHFAAMQATLVMSEQPIANPIPVPLIREVDERGMGPNGEEYHFHASPEALRRRLAVDVPVLLRFPDRRLEEGNEVRFTETAVKMLETDLKASVVPEDPWRQH